MSHILELIINNVIRSSTASSFSSELLDEILDSVISPAEEFDSLEMSEESDDIPPCSEDFEFYMNIAHTVPPHSPGNQTFSSFSNTSEGPTPPTSPDPATLDSVNWSEKEDEKEALCKDDSQEEEDCTSSQRSQGIYLEATQVPLLTQKPFLFSQEEVEDKDEFNVEEDLRLSSEPRNVDNTEAELVNVTNVDSSSDEGDSTSALPLAFNCRADLDKKLNRVDPRLVVSSSPELAGKHKIKSEPSDLAKKIKLEPAAADNIETKEETAEKSGSEVRQHSH